MESGFGAGDRGQPCPCPRRLRQAVTVFCKSIAIVIGPTPPGTGEMAEATLLALSK